MVYGCYTMYYISFVILDQPSACHWTHGDITPRCCIVPSVGGTITCVWILLEGETLSLAVEALHRLADCPRQFN